MSGWNPPPAPGGPPGPGPYGYGPPGPPGQPGAPGPAPYPPPPPRRSNTGLIIGLVAGIGLIFVVLAVVVVVVVATSGNHSIGEPPGVAGTYVRDHATESRLDSELSRQRQSINKITGNKVRDVQTAVYGSGSEKFLFIGGNADYDPDLLESEFRTGLNTGSTEGVSMTVIPLADAGGDGEAVCASIRSTSSSLRFSTAVCAWATTDTFGMIMPVPETGGTTAPRSYTYSTVATAMRLMRADLED